MYVWRQIFNLYSMPQTGMQKSVSTLLILPMHCSILRSSCKDPQAVSSHRPFSPHRIDGGKPRSLFREQTNVNRLGVYQGEERPTVAILSHHLVGLKVSPEYVASLSITSK